MSAATVTGNSRGSIDPLQDDVPALVRLRTGTRMEHSALHGVPVLAAFAKGTISREDYSAMMEVFAGFYAGMDGIAAEACRVFGAEASGYRYSSRCERLIRDVAALEGRTVAYMPASFPSIRSPAQLAGLLYVIDGSLLGGAQLMRSAHKVSPSGHGIEHWRWCRDNCDVIWPAARRLVGSFAEGPTGARTAVETAGTCFATLLNCFHEIGRRGARSA